MKKIMKIALSLILCAGMILSAFALVLDTAEETQPDADYVAVL